MKYEDIEFFNYLDSQDDDDDDDFWEDCEEYEQEERESHLKCLEDDSVTGFSDREKEIYAKLLSELSKSLDDFTAEIKPSYVDAEPKFFLSQIIENLEIFDNRAKEIPSSEHKMKSILNNLVQNDIQQAAIAMGSLDND